MEPLAGAVIQPPAASLASPGAPRTPLWGQRLQSVF